MHRVRMATRGQAERVGSQQGRLTVAIRAGSAAAEAQRVGSHETGSAADCSGGSRGHVRRCRDLLEQAHANVINGRGADRAVTRGTITGAVSAIGIRGERRHVHQRIQADDARLRRAELSAHFLVVYAGLLEVVDKVAARSVRAEADRVEGAAQLGLVLGMAGEIAQLAVSVRELALVAVFARTVLLVRPAELGLVAGRWLAHAAIQFAVLLDQRGH